jgi:predicted Zn-dependent protease
MKCLLSVLLVAGTLTCTVQAEETERTITLLNAAGLDEKLTEEIRGFAQEHLYLQVSIRQADILKAGSFENAFKLLNDRKTENDVLLIGLAGGLAPDGNHLDVAADTNLAVVNVAAMWTEDVEIFKRRLQRQVMRAAGFLFGLEPAPDPFCVTRHYRTLKELDNMGMNFHPPWQFRFRQESAKRGLNIQRERVPPQPPTPPAP